MTEEVKKALVEVRHQKGLYSTKELRAMFGIGRHVLDNALNSGQLKWISPNNRDRFVYLSDFLKWSEENGGSKNDR